MLGLILPLLLIIFCAYVILRAGDSFIEGSNYIGRNLQDGVKGATINAVASSMPELFISMFFLFYLQDLSGFSGGVGTSFGSVLFNALIIPSVSILGVLSVSKKKHIKISKKIVIRDGLWLVFVQLLLIYFIQKKEIGWLESLILVLIYCLYVFYLFKTMKGGHKIDYEAPFSEKEKVSLLSSFMIFDLKRILLGNKKLNAKTAWFVFTVSSLVIGVVCYFLVLACEWLGSETYFLPIFGELTGLGIPLLFVALIFSAIGSSFPDSIISYKDAQKGNYDDAISNAYGSNIFNLCVALGGPLFIYTIYNGTIFLTDDLVFLISSISYWFLGLSIVSILTYTYGDGVNKARSYFLIFLYLIFVLFVFYRASF